MLTWTQLTSSEESMDGRDTNVRRIRKGWSPNRERVDQGEKGSVSILIKLGRGTTNGEDTLARDLPPNQDKEVCIRTEHVTMVEVSDLSSEA
ncbi:Hypp246 [Branchiostoma lanceolatum]|uniref:Hypp246 protein n=1 Tax=Branchiostoma lanceolatum TaxID=7740 RepID=A0A8J9VKR4_BRALA|nr:Hypp246 [Branchiostoma lanceolatum]